MRMSANRREGIALAAAIAAIVVIGALIAGAFFASTQDYREGRNTLIAQRAFNHAELGLNDAIARWNTNVGGVNLVQADLLTEDQGYSLTWQPTLTGARPGDSVRVRFTKVNPITFWVTADGYTGRADGSGADAAFHSTLNQVLRLELLSFNTLGGLVAKGAVKVGGNSQVNGNGQAPTGWDCTGVENDSVAGVASGDTSKVTTSGSGSITGKPPKTQTSKASNDSTYSQFGSMSYDSLKKVADIKIPTSVLGSGTTGIKVGAAIAADGTCMKKDSTGAVIYTNWGDPIRDGGPCENYFPTIYAPGNLSLQTGQGQGILLVDGDLTITGNFQFYGIVLIKGMISLKGTGQAEGKLIGIVMAGGADLGDKNELLGNANIQYSNCAIQKALQSSGKMKRLPERSFAELF